MPSPSPDRAPSAPSIVPVDLWRYPPSQAAPRSLCRVCGAYATAHATWADGPCRRSLAAYFGKPATVGDFAGGAGGADGPAIGDALAPAVVADSRPHRPADGARWSFDADVTAVFDDMLARSIPDLAGMRDAVVRLGRRYVTRGTAIVDLGASKGDALDPYVRAFGAANHFVACEIAPPMLDALRARFAGYAVPRGGVGSGPIVDIRALDLRREYPAVGASLTLAVLTLQFVPVEYRARVLRRAYDATLPGGALVVVEKITGATADLADAFVDEYHALKRANGYGDDAIERKRLALEGALVPLSADENVARLKTAGFAEVDCFWRWFNFAGFVAVKAASASNAGPR